MTLLEVVYRSLSLGYFTVVFPGDILVLSFLEVF